MNDDFGQADLEDVWSEVNQLNKKTPELRDYFAASALNGMLAYSNVNPQIGNYHENCTLEQAAATAYAYADAMLAARNQQPAEDEVKADALAAIEGAMAIECLWGPGPLRDSPEHEGEGQALDSMRRLFRNVLAKAKGGAA